MLYRLITFSTMAICVVILKLYSDGALRLYIHPRYEIFTITLVSFGLCMIVIDYFKRKQQPTGWSSWIVFAVAVASVIIPPSSLSDSFASERLNSNIANIVPEQTSYDNFSSDLTRFDIRDWHAYLSSSPPADSVVGKQARLNGFLFTSEGQLFIARYQLTCCAVDATPLSVPLVESEELTSIENGTWLQLTGTMEKTDNHSHPFQLQTEDIKITEIPDQPYVY